MIEYGIVVHGGAGSSKILSGGCRKACESGFRLLESGKDAIDAVTEAVTIMEDDGRFNAGSGSLLRLDGKTVEMDASVMDSTGRIGAVIGVKDVKNPIQAARAVTRTPHIVLSGQGADIFAKLCGLPRFDRVSPRALMRHRELLRLVTNGKLRTRDKRWNSLDLKKMWNFERPYEEVFAADTVGAVAIDKAGHLGVASSTGGASPMMLGRVGDTPLPGCGFYAGSAAVVAATGIGEEIIRKMLAKTVYDMVVAGKYITAACEDGVNLFPRAIPIGIIGMSAHGYAIRANRKMAGYSIIKEI
jgi:L-asparaginase/beta-aspartyl-peptidase (threonine type)